MERPDSAKQKQELDQLLVLAYPSVPPPVITYGDIRHMPPPHSNATIDQEAVGQEDAGPGHAQPDAGQGVSHLQSKDPFHQV
jgi:hypothetical protein